MLCGLPVEGGNIQTVAHGVVIGHGTLVENGQHARVKSQVLRVVGGNVVSDHRDDGISSAIH
jgi:hypothetical protein